MTKYFIIPTGSKHRADNIGNCPLCVASVNLDSHTAKYENPGFLLIINYISFLLELLPSQSLVNTGDSDAAISFQSPVLTWKTPDASTVTGCLRELDWSNFSSDFAGCSIRVARVNT